MPAARLGVGPPWLAYTDAGMGTFVERDLTEHLGTQYPGTRSVVTLTSVAIITVVSIILMLSCTSPELSWDEADYVTSTAKSWNFLWSGSDYNRHSHGPMAIYLAKLGEEVLPAWSGSFEARLRFFAAVVGSIGVGFLYWIFRYCFGTSRSGALVGAGLLVFSVIRLEETNIVGPHHLMLACTIAIIGLGYRWRDQPTVLAAVVLGAVMGFGALSMTYVIPVALCWVAALFLAGGNWIAWDRGRFKIARAIPIMVVTAVVVVAVLWPPGVWQHVVISNFRWYLHYSHTPTLVGDRVYEVTPRWAALYWLAHLDAPILAFSSLIIGVAFWKALSESGHFSCKNVSSKHIYLSVSLSFFIVTALTAHMAGPRNLLQFVGVLCLAAGALFDEAFGDQTRVGRLGCVAILVIAALNLLWLSRSSSYTPSLATSGYRAFLQENHHRLGEKAKWLVASLPALEIYAQQSGMLLTCDIEQMAWSTLPTAPLPADTKYVLMPAIVYDHMPADQPMRRVVAEHWKVVWSHKQNHTWELRLYENPATAP